MSKIITFSRVFPSYHPKAGQSTGFVEKIWESIAYMDYIYAEQFPIPYESLQWDRTVQGAKHHTIRAGHRFKVGDWFSPRVWSGKPYNSKQIQFAPDIQVKKTWDFEMDKLGVCAIAKPGEQVIYTFEYDDKYPESLDNEIAKNDGLTPEDFYWWFSRSPDFKKSEDGFDGQIICWSDSIDY